MSSHTKEVLDTAMGSVNRHLGDVYTALFPLFGEKLFSAWLSVSSVAVGAFACMGHRLEDAVARLSLCLDTVGGNLSHAGQRLAELFAKCGEGLGEADSALREAIEVAKENINRLKK